jgi:hypothetical protein
MLRGVIGLGRCLPTRGAGSMSAPLDVSTLGPADRRHQGAVARTARAETQPTCAYTGGPAIGTKSFGGSLRSSADNYSRAVD